MFIVIDIVFVLSCGIWHTFHYHPTIRSPLLLDDLTAHRCSQAHDATGFDAEQEVKKPSQRMRPPSAFSFCSHSFDFCIMFELTRANSLPFNFNAHLTHVTRFGMSAHTHHGPARFGCVLRIDHAEMLPGLLVMVVLWLSWLCWCCEDYGDVCYGDCDHVCCHGLLY